VPRKAGYGHHKPKHGGFRGHTQAACIFKTRRAREVWRYIIRALARAGFDYQSALLQIAMLADKVDTWRSHVDAIDLAGWRYDEDSNGGSLKQTNPG
jgi:hypothetical protein